MRDRRGSPAVFVLVEYRGRGDTAVAEWQHFLRWPDSGEDAGKASREKKMRILADVVIDSDEIVHGAPGCEW